MPEQQAPVALIRKQGGLNASIKQVQTLRAEDRRGDSSLSQKPELAADNCYLWWSHRQVFWTAASRKRRSTSPPNEPLLQPKGITVVKAIFKDNCLQILLESACAESASTSGICQPGLTPPAASSNKWNLRAADRRGVSRLESGHWIGRTTVVVISQPSLSELAQQGNAEAIAALMNRFAT